MLSVVTTVAVFVFVNAIDQFGMCVAGGPGSGRGDAVLLSLSVYFFVKPGTNKFSCEQAQKKMEFMDCQLVSKVWIFITSQGFVKFVVPGIVHLEVMAAKAIYPRFGLRFGKKKKTAG